MARHMPLIVLAAIATESLSAVLAFERVYHINITERPRGSFSKLHRTSILAAARAWSD
jgi:hypothetical protein